MAAIRTGVGVPHCGWVCVSLIIRGAEHFSRARWHPYVVFGEKSAQVFCSCFGWFISGKSALGWQLGRSRLCPRALPPRPPSASRAVDPSGSLLLLPQPQRGSRWAPLSLLLAPSRRPFPRPPSSLGLRCGWQSPGPHEVSLRSRAGHATWQLSFL